MWDIVADALRRWSILLIGLVLIVGGFWLGTLLYSSDSPQAQITSGRESPAPEFAASGAAERAVT